jgi:GT2 family glycosyltransferase/glycosyltransferase involved in cell wall biosynthesis
MQDQVKHDARRSAATTPGVQGRLPRESDADLLHHALEPSVASLVDLRRAALPAGHVFPTLLAPQGAAKAKGRICIVSTELVGARNNGGIGTAQTNLAKVLAAAGHQVTILFFRKPDRPLTDELKAHYAGLGIEVAQDDNFDTEHYGRGRMRYPFGAYEWLRRRDFDVVHAPELHAYLYFAMLAKRTGLAFRNTAFVVGTHCSSEWLAELNHTPLSEKDHLIAAYMERASVALADYAWSPSHYLLEWMRSADWPVGANTHFHALPYLPYEQLALPDRPASAPIDELVFFGRLQKRKGIELFCDAVDRLQPAIKGLGRKFKVTFLGDNELARFGLPEDFHVRRAANWGHEWQHIADYNVVQALAYLSQPGRLAVIPSLSDNSPNTIHECLLYGIPFAASNVGGIPELVAPADHDRALFATRPDDCARVLAALLGAPARPVKAANLSAAVNASWVDWHDAVIASLRAAPAAKEEAALPSITVCVATFNRTRLLWQALAGLERQTYRNFDVVVVDDGSTNPEDCRELERVGAWLAERGWKLVRQDNSYLGATRNRGAAEASGDFLFFLDDDDSLVPHALEILAKAQAYSGADLLDPVYMNFVSEDAPNAATEIHSRYIALGGGLAMSCFWNTNTFGGAAFLVRRTSFIQLGGFTTDYGVGHEDWEFLIRAELAGLRLYHLPEPLVWVRKSKDGMQATGDRFRDNRRSLRPLIERSAPYQRLLLMYAQDVGRERDQYRDVAYALAWERDQLQGKLQVTERALAATQQVNDVLMGKAGGLLDKS